MKITKTKLKQIIKEELKTVLDETELQEINVFSSEHGQEGSEGGADQELHWTEKDYFVHPNQRGPVDKYERMARDKWDMAQRDRSWADKQEFPGDVKGSTEFKHAGRVYGGKS